MTAPAKSFPASLFSLWLRLGTVFVVGLLFFLMLIMPERLAGWHFYLSSAEVAFEVAVFTVFVALTGVALGAICTAMAAPWLFYRQSSAHRLVESVTRAAIATTAFIDFGVALNALAGDRWSSRVEIAVFACYVVAFGAVLWVPRYREQLVTSLDFLLRERAARRALICMGLCTVALVTAEAVMGGMATSAEVSKHSRPSGPNIVLITFDALSAEDMSLYGYRLPTTPHIDEFARKSSVFEYFYSSSTFTTPSIAAMLTGLQPSEHHVYQIQGRFHGADGLKTLPHAMRDGGYSTGASISNPPAFFVAQAMTAAFDILPAAPLYRQNIMHIWNATRLLHQDQPFGSRLEEFWSLENAWDYVPKHLAKFSPRLFSRHVSDSPPEDGFKQAREVLARMPDGFFLWVHLYAPHAPYLPGAQNLGRFLPTDEMRTAEEQTSFPSTPLYRPDRQKLVDKARLRYDELLADADLAFGSFLSELEASGRMRNTAVIVSADHGESFEGGLYTHNSRYQTRPEIHIPLIIHMPGQERGSRIALAADQTVLAPTILEIVGLPRAEWMHAPSLVPWLNRDNQGLGQGLAFTQYLATNSRFRPLRNGTVGVIDGRHQYVLDIATGKGILRGLEEAYLPNLDRSAESPELAKTLREAIYARFPELPKTAP